MRVKVYLNDVLGDSFGPHSPHHLESRERAEKADRRRSVLKLAPALVQALEDARIKERNDDWRYFVVRDLSDPQWTTRLRNGPALPKGHMQFFFATMRKNIGRVATECLSNPEVNKTFNTVVSAVLK